MRRRFFGLFSAAGSRGKIRGGGAFRRRQRKLGMNRLSDASFLAVSAAPLPDLLAPNVASAAAYAAPNVSPATNAATISVPLVGAGGTNLTYDSRYAAAGLDSGFGPGWGANRAG